MLKRSLNIFVIVSIGLILIHATGDLQAITQPPGVELNPEGTSYISWMFETPESDWINTCTMGQGGHNGDDYYADDWARSGAEGQTGEERTFGQIVYAGISGIAIVKANHGPYGNDVIIYDPESKFALRNAHLSEVSVSDGQLVSAGSPIGKVGHSGGDWNSHLHIVLYKNLVEDINNRPITWTYVNINPSPENPAYPPTNFATPFLYHPRVDSGAIKILPVPYYDQGNTEWCVPTSMAMIFKYYYGAEKNIHSWDIAKAWKWERDIQWWKEELLLQPTYDMIREYFNDHGLKTAEKISDAQDFYKIQDRLDIHMPVILYMREPPHAVVIVGYSVDGGSKKVYVNDPSGAFLKNELHDKLGLLPDLELPYIAEPVDWDIVAQYAGGFSYAIAVGSPVDQMSPFLPKGTIDIGATDGAAWNGGLYFSYEGQLPQLYGWMYGLDKGLNWNHRGGHPLALSEKDWFRFGGAITNHTRTPQTYKLEIEFASEGFSPEPKTFSVSVDEGSSQGSVDEPIVENPISLRDYLKDESGEYTITLALWNSDLTENYDEIVFPSIEYSGTEDTTPPTQILSPVVGPLEVVNDLQDCSNTKWCFNQHKTGGHAVGGGIGQADDYYAWDVNLNYPAWDADAGRPVYTAASGIVAEIYGSRINVDGSYGQILIEHTYQDNKWWSGYLHLANIQVRHGQAVTENTILGYISNVSPNPIPNHLHFVVYTGSNILGELKSFSATIVERPDITRPTISITSPSSGQTFTTPRITVEGTASDNVGLSKVEVKVGAGDWEVASGLESWSKQVTLSPGSNTIYARATNTSGSTDETSITVPLILDDIPPIVVVGLPNGGEDWAVSSQQTIRWNATDDVGVDHIDVQFSSDEGASWSNIVIGIANSGQYNWTIPDNVSTLCRIRVIAYDTAGNSGFDESDGNFTISSASPPLTIPTLYDPGILSESGNFRISWSEVSGANRYTLEEDTNPSFSSPAPYVTTDASKYIGGKRNDVYYYRVRAENEFGSSGWSNVVDMEVRVNSAPNVPSNPSPANGATDISRGDLTLSWSGGDPDGTVDYAVLLGTDPSDLTAYRGFGSGQTGEFFKLSFTLNPATTYYWQVKAKDNKGLTTTGPIWNFTTEYSYADIVPTNLTITGTIAPDAQITLNLTVGNQGTFTAPPCEVFFYYSSTNTGKDERFGNIGTTIPELSPGAQATVTKAVTLDHLRAGQSYIVAEINTQRYFIERNLDNNMIGYSINYQDDQSPTITYLNLHGGSGNRFKTGYSYSIVFTVDDDIGIESLDFYYSIDDGTTWSVITTGFVIGSNGLSDSYEWTIPPDMPLITTGKIKMIVRDTSGNTSVGTTDTFTIIDGSVPDVTVLSPNGGEVWDLGSQHEITWEASSPNGIEEVRIYLYWSDTADVITYQAGSITSYMWTLPTPSGFVTNTARIKIRVVDGNGNEAEDGSDDYFTMRDVSELPPAPWATPVNISNTSRESLYPDCVVDSQGIIHVVWNDFTGSSLYGNIYYAKWNGSLWSRPINISHTDGVKNTMNPAAIAVDSSNLLHVVWTDYSNNPNNADIYYTKWDGASWSTPINVSNNSGHSQSPRIAIDSSNNLHVVWFDNSSGGYKLFYKKYNGATWLGTEQISPIRASWADIAVDSLNNLHIVWTSGDIDPQRDIYYRKWDGSWQTIINISNSPSIASYIPRIAIDSTENLHVVWYDYTPGNYDIYYAKFNGSSWSSNINITNSTDQSVEPSIAIDSVGYPHIVWREYNTASLICHAYWNGSSWSCATRINRTSDYPEHPALSISSTDRLQVFWSNGYGEIFYNYADIDIGLDTEAPTVTLTSPAGGEQLSIGETYEIRWNASDNVGVSSISLKYTTDGETFTEIASGESNDGTYQWDVPNIVSDTVQIWVVASDATGNQGVAISGYFSISDQTAPNVSLTSPNGGETWMVESPHDITWSAMDNVEVGSIDLFYSTDAGNSWLNIAKDEPNDGTYSWTIPYNLSSNCKVKVIAYDSSSQMSTDVSDGTFSITTGNNPPCTPHSPVPVDGSTNVCITIELIWIGGDPDSEDAVTYDVYLGTESDSMNLTSDDQPNTSYTLSTLNPNITYYWQIIASDRKESSDGPIWSFTTGTENINAPSNLSAVTISNNQIDLSWEDNSDNEESFKIERKKETDEVYGEIAVVGPDSCTYSDVGLNGGTTYIYRVGAYYGSVHSAYSNEARAATVNSPPNTPAVLLPLDDATNQAISSVVLKWQGGDPDLGDTVTYAVYFGTRTEPPLISDDQSEITYNPETLDYHKFYFWKIVAIDNHGAQTPGPLWSFSTEPEPLPGASDSLIVVSVSNDRVELRWNDNAENEIGFKIERRIDEGASIQIYTVGSNVTTYSDTGLADGATYHYRLRAYNASGNSEYSDIVSVTTPILDILGDVDNGRTVNITDALIVATYELDPNITIPNGGKIELGDVNGDDMINIADALMIATYDLNPENPYLPPGIAQPISPAKFVAGASLTEDLYPEGSIVVKLSPSETKPSLGETMAIAIAIDMAQVEEKLGAYSAILRWNPKVLEYAGYEGGNTGGFDHPLVMEGEVDKGRLKFNQFNPEGVSGQVNIMNVTFVVKGEFADHSLEIELSSLTAAHSFLDLLPYTKVSVPQEILSSIPESFSLSQSYPNPFNAITTIRYSIPAHSLDEDRSVSGDKRLDGRVPVVLKIYNIRGQLVRILVNEGKGPGRHVVRWDGCNNRGSKVGSGIYVYRLQAGNFGDAKKMVMVQ